MLTTGRRLISIIGLTTAIALAPPSRATGEEHCADLRQGDVASVQSAVSALQEDGFLEQRDNGNAYFPRKLAGSDAASIAGSLRALSAEPEGRGAVIFYLKLAGASLQDEGEATCFVRGWMMADTDELVRDLRLMSALIERKPNATLVSDAMLAVAQEIDGEQTMAFLKAIQAVYFTGSGGGFGKRVDFSRSKAAHLPNVVMRAFAENLDPDESGMRTIIYQVERMGIE